jgi:hypothetical protein
MIITRPWSLNAFRGLKSMRWVAEPVGTASRAGILIVVLSIIAVVATLLVLRIVSVPVTASKVSGHNGNIAPEGRMPIWIVITLLLALKSSGVSSRILTGVLSISVVSGILISSEEILVTSTSVAGIEEAERLMTTNGGVILVGFGNLSCASVRLSITSKISWGSILDGIIAGVLPDNVALNVAVGTAGMLIVPFEGQLRTRVIGHWLSPGVSTSIVVLRVEQTLGITIVVVLITTVVRTSGIVKIDIGTGSKYHGEKNEEKESSLHYSVAETCFSLGSRKKLCCVLDAQAEYWFSH